MLIGLVLPPGHPWRNEAPALGTVAWDGQVGGLLDAARGALDVLLLDAAELGAMGIEQLRTYRIARHTTRLVVSHSAAFTPGDPLMASLVSFGVYDLVAEGAPLVDTLVRPATYADAARWQVTAATAHGSGVQILERTRTEKAYRSSRIVAVLSPKGGVGKSTTAANLAVQAARLQVQVAALDFNLGMPNLGVHFGIERDSVGLAEACQSLPGMEPGFLRRFMTERHGVQVLPVGFRRGDTEREILALPTGLSEEESQWAAREKLSAVLEAARESFGLTVVDLSTSVEDLPTFIAITRALRIYLVTDRDSATLQETGRLLHRIDAQLSRLGLGRDKLRLLVNRNGRAGVPIPDIEAELKLRAVAAIPYEPEGYLEAVQAGKPYSLGLPKDNPWRLLALDALDDEESPEPAQVPKAERRRFWWPFSRRAG